MADLNVETLTTGTYLMRRKFNSLYMTFMHNNDGNKDNSWMGVLNELKRFVKVQNNMSVSHIERVTKLKIYELE